MNTSRTLRAKSSPDNGLLEGDGIRGLEDWRAFQQFIFSLPWPDPAPFTDLTSVLFTPFLLQLLSFITSNSDDL